MSGARTRTAPFSAATALALVAVGIFGFSAFLVLMAYAPDLQSGHDGGGHALSRSAVGMSAVVDMLKASGEPVLVSRNPHPPNDATPGVLVLTPANMPEVKDIEAFGFQGPVLIVLPKWEVTRDPLHPGWVKKAGAAPPPAYADGVLKAWGGPGAGISRRSGVSRPQLGSAKAQEFTGWRVQPAGPITDFQTLSEGKLLPMITDETGATVVGAVPDGAREIYILSDPDLLANHGVADLATARAGVAVLDAIRSHKGPIIFDVTLNGYSRGRSLLKTAFEPPFLAATICAVMTALLMGLHALARFGPAIRPDRAFALGKRGLADNSAALITLARREPRMAVPYAEMIRAEVARAIGAPPALDAAGLDAFLDRIADARRVAGRISHLMVRAHTINNRADLLRLAQDLYRWRLEMTRERS